MFETGGGGGSEVLQAVERGAVEKIAAAAGGGDEIDFDENAGACRRLEDRIEREGRAVLGEAVHGDGGPDAIAMGGGDGGRAGGALEPGDFVAEVAQDGGFGVGFVEAGAVAQGGFDITLAGRLEP